MTILHPMVCAAAAFVWVGNMHYDSKKKPRQKVISDWEENTDLLMPEVDGDRTKTKGKEKDVY